MKKRLLLIFFLAMHRCAVAAVLSNQDLAAAVAEEMSGPETGFSERLLERAQRLGASHDQLQAALLNVAERNISATEQAGDTAARSRAILAVTALGDIADDSLLPTLWECGTGEFQWLRAPGAKAAINAAIRLDPEKYLPEVARRLEDQEDTTIVFSTLDHLLNRTAAEPRLDVRGRAAVERVLREAIRDPKNDRIYIDKLLETHYADYAQSTSRRERLREFQTGANAIEREYAAKKLSTLTVVVPSKQDLEEAINEVMQVGAFHPDLGPPPRTQLLLERTLRMGGSREQLQAALFSWVPNDLSDLNGDGNGWVRTRALTALTALGDIADVSLLPQLTVWGTSAPQHLKFIATKAAIYAVVRLDPEKLPEVVGELSKQEDRVPIFSSLYHRLGALDYEPPLNPQALPVIGRVLREAIRDERNERIFIDQILEEHYADYAQSTERRQRLSELRGSTNEAEKEYATKKLSTLATTPLIEIPAVTTPAVLPRLAQPPKGPEPGTIRK